MNRQRDARRADRVRRPHRRACCRRARGRATCARCCVTLERLQLGRETNVAKPLHQLADALTKRGMVVLISDLLDDPGDGRSAG